MGSGDEQVLLAAFQSRGILAPRNGFQARCHGVGPATTRYRVSLCTRVGLERDRAKIARLAWWHTMKPCPFCSSAQPELELDATVAEGPPNTALHYAQVCCFECGARGPKKSGDDEAGAETEAREAWNERRFA